MNLVNDLQVAIEDIDSRIQQYDAFLDWFDDAESRWDDFNEDEKEAFRESFDEYHQYAEETIPPEKIEVLHEGLRRLFRQPLAERVLESISELKDTLEVSLSNTEELMIEEGVNTSTRDGLLMLRDGYEEAIPLVDDLSTEAKMVVKNTIEENPQILLSPDERLKPGVREVVDRQNSLESISSALKDCPWLELMDEDIGVFSADWLRVETADAEAVRESITEIDDAIEAIENSGATISPAIQDIIESLLVSPNDDWTYRLTLLADELQDLSQLATPLMEIQTAAETVRDASDEFPQKDWLISLAEEMQSEEFDSLEHAYTTFETYVMEVDDWKEYLVSSWSTHVSVFTVLEDRIDIEEINVLEEVEDFNSLVDQDLPRAIDSLDSLLIQIRDKRREIQEEGTLPDESVSLLFDLIEDGFVSLDEYELGTFSSLNEIIDLKVEINESV